MTDILDKPSTLTLTELEHALRQNDASAVLVPSWLLENIIAADREIRGPLFSMPHDRSHVITRERLLQVVADEELPLPAEPPGEPTLILLARPDADWLSSTPAPQVLLAFWRLLFHARVDALFRGRAIVGAALQSKIEKIGRSAFREAAFVLQKERSLAGGADDAEAYGEFASTFLELLHFEPWMLHWYFPAADAERVLAVLSEDLDAAALLEATRLSGTAEPAQEPAEASHYARIQEPDAEPEKDRPEKNRKKGKAILERAQAAEERGNDVRAALLRIRAARLMGSDAGKTRSSAGRRVDALAARLRAALNLDEADYDPWRAVLRSLLNKADLGWWNNERRLLYDLQKACVCHEREIYSANVVEWVLDRGRRPLRRAQPAQRLVTSHKALRSAERRAAKARLHPHDQAALRRLIHTAVESAEHRVRTDLRPAIIHALEDGDLRPHTTVERVAEEKLVDELLDGIVHRGYLNLGNLRDAVSRSQLKLNDLSGPREWIGRDQLLRVDLKLEHAIDGVYHRGEVYLRFFQRLSALLFGTSTGRFLTRVLLIPFIGAFIVLEGLDHSVGKLIAKLAHKQPHFAHPAILVLLAIFIMALVNWPALRSAIARGARAVGRRLRVVFLDLPKWIGRLPIVRLMFNSPVARMLFRYAVKPLAIATIALLLIPGDASAGTKAAVVLGVYLATTVFLNSPAGRALEQTLLHALRVTVPRMTWDILLGMFRLVMYVFDRLLENVDRALYAVDEWLRFGQTQSRVGIVFKAALGVVWFYIAYFTRFVVNLLVEPQINPIKHFPVVTVSHKIMIPLTPALAKGFSLAGLNEGTAWTLAGGIITGTPGVFGFLAWELKENWKLYRRNRPAVLRPVRVGSHGETLAQLLRPGFHSGTLPKLFARVRKSARRGSGAAQHITHREQETANHVRHDVAAFVERELVSLLDRHPLWADTQVTVGEVELAATRIRIELHCEALEVNGPARISFDQRDGLIVAQIERAGWMAKLPPAQIELLRVAIVGFYKLASVDVVAEHIAVPFDVRRRQLILWSDGQFDREVSFDLSDPAEETLQLLFTHVDVPWSVWKRTWESRSSEAIAECTGQIAPNVEVLPAACRRDVNRTSPPAGFPVPQARPAPTASSSVSPLA